MLSSVQRAEAAEFPRDQKRGLIEARGRVGRRPSGTPFPRDQKRGLIEAISFAGSCKTLRYFPAIKSGVSLKPMRYQGGLSTGSTFPRDQKRGLIEAA